MKIFTSHQIQQADAYTIEHEPISSIDLMERASHACTDAIEYFHPQVQEFHIFCGKGNNGGDGLAIARILTKKHKQVSVHIISTSDSSSTDFAKNLERLSECISPINHLSIHTHLQFEPISVSSQAIIIDSIFGTGLNKPITGVAKQAIEFINSIPNHTISVDIPSGLFCDSPTAPNSTIIKADQTFTFQYPKLQFMFAENEQYTGEWHILNIGLSQEFESKTPTQFEFTTIKDIYLHSRSSFAHKGKFGHALIIAGSKGKIGAAVLASKACINSGCGLVTTHVPSHGNNILQSSVPEVMTSIDSDEWFISRFPDTQVYSAIGIGPGLGTDASTINAFTQFLQSNSQQLVIDADALNILSTHKELLSQLPSHTILTPHPGEFDRLTHKHTNGYERLLTQIEFSKTYKVIVVLKGKYTSISYPDGQVCFNSSGNPGMATAGSGDVLTGIIVSLVCQAYSIDDAVKIAVCIHGLSADLLLLDETVETVTAQKIIGNLAKAFKKITQKK